MVPAPAPPALVFLFCHVVMCVAKQFPNIIYEHFVVLSWLCRNVIATYCLISFHYLLLRLPFINTKTRHGTCPLHLSKHFVLVSIISFLYVFTKNVKQSIGEKQQQLLWNFLLQNEVLVFTLGFDLTFFFCCLFYTSLQLTKFCVTWKHFQFHTKYWFISSHREYFCLRWILEVIERVVSSKKKVGKCRIAQSSKQAKNTDVIFHAPYSTLYPIICCYILNSIYIHICIYLCSYKKGACKGHISLGFWFARRNLNVIYPNKANVIAMLSWCCVLCSYNDLTNAIHHFPF